MMAKTYRKFISLISAVSFGLLLLNISIPTLHEHLHKHDHVQRIKLSGFIRSEDCNHAENKPVKTSEHDESCYLCRLIGQFQFDSSLPQIQISHLNVSNNFLVVEKNHKLIVETLAAFHNRAPPTNV